jgi:HlyD family secretion protein
MMQAGRNPEMKTKRTGYLLPVLILLLAALVTGCDSLPIGGQEEPTAAPIVNVGPETVSVTGEVMPAQESLLSFQSSGQMVELLVEVGDAVAAGDVIARLDTTLLDAEVAKAEAALSVAEANLVLAETGARPQEIDEASSNTAASNAQVAVTAAQRNQLATSVGDAAILQAEAAVHQAQVALDAASTQLRYVQQAELDKEGYENPYTDYPMTEQEINRIKGWETDANENYAIALAGYQQAVTRLEQLQNGANEDDLRAAQAEVWAAAADYQASQANLADLEAGPLAEDIAVAAARVEQAQAALEQAQLNQSRAVLEAPFGGTVSELYVRDAQYINPGEPVLLLSDLDTLRIETTDLNEIDVAQIAVGDEAIITFDALPDVEIQGTVLRIDPKSAEGAGVNYTAVIVADDLPADVRWGMTAFVDIPTE